MVKKESEIIEFHSNAHGPCIQWFCSKSEGLHRTLWTLQLWSAHDLWRTPGRDFTNKLKSTNWLKYTNSLMVKSTISQTNSGWVTVSTLPVESVNLRLPLSCLKSVICLKCQQNDRLFVRLNNDSANFKQFKIKKTPCESTYIRFY